MTRPEKKVGGKESPPTSNPVADAGPTSSTPVRIEEYWRVAPLADSLGVARTTLLKAVDRGDVNHARLGDGLPVVEYKSARDWVLSLNVERPRNGSRSLAVSREPQLSDKTLALFATIANRKKRKAGGQ